MISKFLGFDNSLPTDPLGVIRILPIPYDSTASYRPGSRFGPSAILGAFKQLEFFNDEIQWDATDYLHFLVEDEIVQNVNSAEEMMVEISQIVSQLISPKEFLFCLGGEHSISSPIVKAHLSKFPDLHVVQIDAHADLRNTWNGSRFSHACVMRRISELGINITQIGIRNLSKEGFEFLSSPTTSQVRMWKAEDLKKKDFFDELISHLKNEIKSPIYLTLDVDGMDPSVIPATSTPEPGGLSWYETIEIIQTICLNNNVVGADLVELTPIPGYVNSDFAAAKLVYKIISFTYYRKWLISNGG